MLDKKLIKKNLKAIITNTYSWLVSVKIKGSDWFDDDLNVDDEELGYLKAPIQEVFKIEIKKREIRDCIDINDLVDVIAEKIERQFGSTSTQGGTSAFFIALFSLGAKIAKADGQVSQEEVNAMENLMQNIMELDSDSRRYAINIWNEAKSSNRSFDDYAYDFLASNPTQQNISGVFELLFYIAAADKRFHPTEENLIRRALQIFGLPSAEFDRLKSSYFVDTAKFYAILGCSSHDSMEIIRTKYKKLLLEYHPDKMNGKNLPPDMLKFAETKTRELIEAYENIERERGLRI